MIKTDMYHDSFNKILFDQETKIVYVEIDGVTKYKFPASNLETVSPRLFEGAKESSSVTVWILCANANDIELILPSNGSIERLGSAIQQIKNRLNQ